ENALHLDTHVRDLILAFTVNEIDDDLFLKTIGGLQEQAGAGVIKVFRHDDFGNRGRGGFSVDRASGGILDMPLDPELDRLELNPSLVLPLTRSFDSRIFHVHRHRRTSRNLRLDMTLLRRDEGRSHRVTDMQADLKRRLWANSVMVRRAAREA